MPGNDREPEFAPLEEDPQTPATNGPAAEPEFAPLEETPQTPATNGPAAEPEEVHANFEEVKGKMIEFIEELESIPQKINSQVKAFREATQKGNSGDRKINRISDLIERTNTISEEGVELYAYMIGAHLPEQYSLKQMVEESASLHNQVNEKVNLIDEKIKNLPDDIKHKLSPDYQPEAGKRRHGQKNRQNKLEMAQKKAEKIGNKLNNKAGKKLKQGLKQALKNAPGKALKQSGHGIG